MNDPNIALYILVLIGVGVAGWYLYQIGSRKQEVIRFKIRRMVIFLFTYGIVALILVQQRLPAWQGALISGFAGMGCAWLLVRPPKGGRRIPKAVRRAVIARDLTSKGLNWDPTKYHIDHVVPFSRGGDNSARNLRVVAREKNLRKGGTMPGFRDFLR